MSDREKVIAQIGSGDNCILIKMSTFEGQRVLDIRKHYQPKGCSQLSPTRKGITLTEKSQEALSRILLEKQALIAKWFKNSSTVSDAVDSNTEAEAKATEDAKYNFKIYERDTEKSKNSLFFHIESNGGKEKVYYNSEHPFYSVIHESLENIRKNVELSSEVSKDAEVILFLVDILLLSYFRAKNLLENTKELDAESFFESLEINWSSTLKRYVKERKYMLL